MIKILNQYTKDNMQITEYTTDGITVSHTITSPIPIESINNSEAIQTPSLEDKINYLYYKNIGVI